VIAYRGTVRDSLADRLNGRQKRVLFLATKGLRNAEIASHLGLSERMAKHYVSQLLLIFGASNRTELVGLALTDPDISAALAGECPGQPA
jgi:DNA-binding CsgD family transcriptional regulator